MKVLLATYSAEAHNSYGTVTRELWRRLTTMHPDWEVVQHGWFHKSLEKVNWHIEPTRMHNEKDGTKGFVKEDVYGRLSFEALVSKFRPDVVWTLSDPYMCEYMGQYRSRYGFKLIKHCPVDGVPQPVAWASAIKDCDLFVPVTKFGAEALAPFFENQTKDFIYHGVDTNIFQPYGPTRKAQAKDPALDPKAKVLGFVGHQQWRKMSWALFPILKYLITGAYVTCQSCYNVTLATWDFVNKKMGPLPSLCQYCHADSLIAGQERQLYLWNHCFRRNKVAWPPERLRDIWDLGPSVIFTNEMKEDVGISTQDMANLYNMFDVFLGISGGEGFCLPFVEAMACGVPIVYTDYSAQAEIAKGIGRPIKVSGYIPDQIEPIMRAIPDVADAVGQIAWVLDSQATRNEMIAKGLIAAREVFSWDIIAGQWSEAITSRFSSRKVSTIGISI